MNDNSLPQNAAKTIDIHEFGAVEALDRAIKKLKNNDVLSFEEQCVVMVASTAFCSSDFPTVDYFKGQQQRQPVIFHPLIEKFIQKFPTDQQVSFIDFGALMCGYNTDGTERFPVKAKNKREYLGRRTYIIRKRGTNEVKIGMSTQVGRRVRTLKTQSGCEMDVLCVLDKNIETMLHRQFAEFRTVGEWFDDSKGLIAAFAKKQRGDTA